jgi:hypothetical protein
MVNLGGKWLSETRLKMVLAAARGLYTAEGHSFAEMN